MRRPALYSRSTRPPPDDPDPALAATFASDPAEAPVASFFKRVAKKLSPHRPYLLWSAIGLLALMLALSLFAPLHSPQRRLTQEDINAAVIKALESTVMPSPGVKAYDAIIPSVVRIVGMNKSSPDRDGTPRSIGTGVVIVDKGVILTNLHVVQGAETIKITFADGLESTATITGTQPENDLAVLQAATIPDDLIAATMRSTADLAPGDRVMAVGYPFGIGPSASEGVISGLNRNFRSPEGKQMMSKLIQFDAAANPGNSGGPLVTMDGELIGIVTAIYNPNQQRTFVGIGFAVPIEQAVSAAGMSPF